MDAATPPPHPFPAQIARRRSLTTIIVAANLLVFAYLWWQGVSPVRPNVQLMREFGATFGPYVFGDQPWRLVTSNYMHFGWGHLLTNVLCLWGLGRFAEEFYDWADYFLLYTLGGISGSLLSVYMNPMAVGAGASGAIFGIAGALLATLRWGDLQLDPDARREGYKGVLQFAGLNLILGFGLSIVGHVDNYGHMGGLIGGGIGGLLLSRRMGPSASARRFRAVSWIVLAAVFAGVFTAARQSRGFVTPLFAAQQSLARGEYDSAIKQLAAFNRGYPNMAEGHLLLGQALSGKQQFAAAAQAYGRAADVLPFSPQPLILKASAHQRAKELPQAEATYRRLVALAPRSQESHALLAGSLASQRKLAEAEAELQRAIQFADQPVPQYLVALGKLRLDLNKPAEALNALEQARQAGADEEQVLEGSVRAQQMLGNRAEAGKLNAQLAALRQKRAVPYGKRQE